MKKEFLGKVALVTGGSRGIGRAVALKLAQKGASVAINYSENEEAAKFTKKLLEDEGHTSIVVGCDVSSPNEVSDMVRSIEDKLGPIDLLVTNAGIAKAPTDPLALDFDEWKKLFEVNVDGTFLPIRETISGMVNRGYGRIVCISSIAGLGMRPNLISYGTSKAAVIAFVRNLAGAVAPNVRINSLAPGLTDTDMIQTLTEEQREKMISATPLCRIGHPSEMANAVAFLLSDQSSFTTGQTLVADGGRVALP